MSTDVDGAIHDALREQASALDVPEWPGLPPRRATRVSRRTLALAASFALVVAIGITTGVLATGPAVNHSTYALPSNGWRPGDVQLDALAQGPFHAELVDGHACAWIGDVQAPQLWPAGWRVRFHPTELIDPDGNVFAKEGDILHSGGGGLNLSDAPAQCGGDPMLVFSLMNVQRGPVR